MLPYVSDPDFQLYCGDALEVLRELPDESVDCAATSPPFFGLRDYQVEGQIGLEATLEEWRARLVEVFREVRRVLVKTGTLWVEIGTSYDNNKNLVDQPAILAFGMQADGWILRSKNVWHKVNCLPESATDRPTVAHSYVLQFAKSRSYFHNAEAVREPAEWARWGDQTPGKAGWIQPNSKEYLTQGRTTNGPRSTERRHETPGFEQRLVSADGQRNLRSVWSIPAKGFSASAVGYDSPYRASADCPRHGLAADLESWQRAARGEPQDRRDYRIDGSDARRALELDGESVSSSRRSPNHPSSEAPRTPQSTGDHRTHDASSLVGDLGGDDETHGRSCRIEDQHAPAAGSSGSPPLVRSPAATARSTESHRTDLAPATTSPCTPSAQTTDRTGDTSASPESAALFVHTPESRSEASGDSAEGPSGQTRHRSARKCTCTKDSTDHFATFPEALVERILKMACPPGGTVCDPFGGSGTTALVARRLGFKSVLIELSPEYAKMAAERTRQLSLLAS